MSTSKILVIDDTDDDVYFLIRSIRKAGIGNEIEVCEDGLPAKKMLSETTDLPFLIFCDLKMPGMSGFELLEWRTTQQQLKEVPVVIISGSNLEQDIQRARELGCHAYFTKPISPEEVKGVVKDFGPFLVRT